MKPKPHWSDNPLWTSFGIVTILIVLALMPLGR